MAINLVSQIMEFITPDLIGRISSTLGLERGSAQKAIGASVPGLLAGLVGLTSKPEGARQLSSELDQQSPGMLESLKNLGGTSQPGALMERGTSMLSNLFGGRTLGGLSGAIGKFADSPCASADLPRHIPHPYALSITAAPAIVAPG